MGFCAPHSSQGNVQPINKMFLSHQVPGSSSVSELLSKSEGAYFISIPNVGPTGIRLLPLPQSSPLVGMCFEFHQHIMHASVYTSPSITCLQGDLSKSPRTLSTPAVRPFHQLEHISISEFYQYRGPATHGLEIADSVL